MVSWACSHTTDFNSRQPVDGGLDAQLEEDARARDAALERDGDPGDATLSLSEAGEALCDGRRCACSNGEDDDGDMLTDGFDSECTGPFDDDEETFLVNTVREGNPLCTDCFYDGDHTAENDGCDISNQCSIDGIAAGPPRCRTCDAQPSCIANCLPITPNGCDCFGCCQVVYQGSVVPIRLVKTCKMDRIGDPALCPRCELNETCFNPCDACELCPGKTLADLPLGCNNAVACGAQDRCKTGSDCGAFQHCSQGCCVPILF